MTDPPAPPAVARPAAQALRDVFASASYRGDDARRLLQVETGLLLDATSLPIARRRVAAHQTPLAALVTLFLLGDALEEPERRLGSGAELLVDAGLAREEAGTLRREVSVVPHDDVLIASDDPQGSIGATYVPEVSRSSATLGSLTVRRPVERALDIGTGNGIQAVLASQHAGAVVATDVSERALAFAEFNCALNGVDNVELRLGSFLEPVAGERFGLVVSNPPFAISPENDLVFRDSGLGRDRVSEELVLSLPSVLEPDGFGSMTASWIVEGDDSAARPREWLERAGCDGWVLFEEAVDALTSAVGWTGGGDEAVLDRWLDYFARERIERVAYGVLVLRPKRRDGWTRARSLPDEPGSAGPHLERLFAGADSTDTELAAMPLMLAPDVDIEQLIRRSQEGWQLAHAALKLTGGLPFETTVDESVLELVRTLDGRPLAALLATMPPPERVEVLAVARGLLELGFLVPVE